MIVIEFDQGSDAWLATRRMASESAALLRLSPWFPRTSYEFWEVKSGRSEIRDNPAMARSRELETSRFDPACQALRRKLGRGQGAASS